MLRISRSTLNQYLASVAGCAGTDSLRIPKRLRSSRYNPAHNDYPQKAHRTYLPCLNNPSGQHAWRSNGSCRACELTKDEAILRRDKDVKATPDAKGDIETWSVDDVAGMLTIDRGHALSLFRDLPGVIDLEKQLGTPALSIPQKVLGEFLSGRLVEHGRAGEAIVERIIATAKEHRVDARRMREGRPDERCECGRKKVNFREKCDICRIEARANQPSA